MQGIGVFLTLTNRDGGVEGRYQQRTLGTLQLDGADHDYLEFIYRGAARSRTGDNLQAELILANNPLAMDIMLQATAQRWLATLVTCAVNPRTNEVTRKLSREVWSATVPSYDPETLTVTLQSALDAIGATVPSVTLTATRVGALPTTSRIRNV